MLKSNSHIGANDLSCLTTLSEFREDDFMAKTNYSYEKRQRDLAKKKKKEEKKLRKLASNEVESEQTDNPQDNDAETLQQDV